MAKPICILYLQSIASPVLGNFLQQAIFKNGMRYIKIPGVPYEAVHIFIRFLYSSWYVRIMLFHMSLISVSHNYIFYNLFLYVLCSYDKEEMKKFVLHLLVLSHCYSIPSLKRVCVYLLEQGWLTKENVVDVLQLARKCDAPRLSLFCVRMIVKHFKAISSTEGWKVMKRANPALEQELLESVVEADSVSRILFPCQIFV